MDLLNKGDFSQRQVALITGVSIVAMAILAGLVVGMAMSENLSLTDPDALLQHLQSQTGKFRWGIAGWIAILICDLLAAWGLHIVYKEKAPKLSLITAWFRLSYATILGVAISLLVMALWVSTDGASLLSQLDQGEMTLLMVKGFEGTWSWGLVIFGLHLIGLGVLVFQRNVILRIISILLLVSGIGYLITNLGQLLLPNYAAYEATLETIFMLPMILGEVGLAVWLLVKGGKEWKK